MRKKQCTLAGGKSQRMLFRYLRGIVVGDGAMARLLAAREAEREEGPEPGPADLSRR